MSAPESSGESAAAPVKQVLEWSGGTLDDLVALLSAPAWSARIEVLPTGGGSNPVGEVHVIAGGVSDAIFEGKSAHDSLDKLRAVKGTRFRVEPRLPNPANGDLAVPGPDQGKLEDRPLATLMRYCEEFVLTAGIEVWRASENAKVEYRRGEIVGVTVGGIDAPERLAEVMKWASGSYRVTAPKLTLPETAPKAVAPPAVVAPRSSGAPSKTIFGMPALDPAAIAAAAEKARQSKSGAATSTAVPTPGMPPAAAVPAQAKPTPSRPTTAPAAAAAPPVAAPQPAAPPARTTTVTASVPPAVALPIAAAPPAAAPPPASTRASTNRTIFGVAPPSAAAAAVPPATAPAAAAPAARASTPAAGARPAEPAPAATRPSPSSLPVVEKAPEKAAEKTLEKVQEKAPEKAAAKASDKAAEKASKQPRTPAAPVGGDADATIPTKAPTGARGTPVWTYIGVGFVFGIVLLGIYRLVMTLSH